MPDPAKSASGQPTNQQIWEALTNDPKALRVLSKEAKRLFPEFKPPAAIEAREELEAEFDEKLKPFQEKIAALEQQLTSKRGDDEWESTVRTLRQNGWSEKRIDQFKGDLQKEFQDGKTPVSYLSLAEHWHLKGQALQPTSTTTITGRQMESSEQDLRAMLDDPKSPIFDETEKKKLFKANWEAAKQELAMRP